MTAITITIIALLVACPFAWKVYLDKKIEEKKLAQTLELAKLEREKLQIIQSLTWPL